ncbi:MAG: efflux RND transporter permease subunit, partial [bacterium]
MEEKKSRISDLKDQAGQFFRFTTSRPVAILMVVIGVVVFGWISYKQLPVNLMPDISYPSLTVRTEYTGTAPEEIETTISRPIEQALGVVNNLVSISSISKAGQSDVKLEFTWDTEMNQATADVREKLDQVFLPQEANRPLILRFDPSLDPIMRLGLYGDASLIYLRYLADEEIKRILEMIEGVAAVKVKGGLEEEIRVELNEQQITLIGIDIQQIKNRLSQENVNLAGGNLKEGQTEYLVRTLNEFKSVDEIKNVVIGNWNGREIKVRDVANVSRTFKDREIVTRLAGKESVEIEVFKEADANIVAVAKRVKERVFGTAAQQAFVKRLAEAKSQPEKKKESSDADRKKGPKNQGKQGTQRNREALIARQMTNFLSHQLPQGLKIDLLSDQSVFIQNSVNEVKNTAVLGGILAVVVLFIFLRNMTATMIIGIAIPISIVSTFAPMKMFGVTLNIMSLDGLALGIGMLVDNSIVVLESISRCRQEGDNLVQATVRGVSEVGGAVFASTLTTVAVFFPIVFVQGVAGQIFGNLALTVVFSLFASLAVALFLIPMLSSRQSSRFVQGIQTDEFFKKHIFYFPTQSAIDDLQTGKTKNGLFSKLTSGLVILLKTSGLIFWKSLKAFGALLIAIIKQFAILLLMLLSPPFGLLKAMAYPVLRLLKKNPIQFRLSEWITRFANNPDFWKISYVREVWPDFLINKSAPALIEDMQGIKARFKESGWKGKIGQAFLVPFRLTLALFKFIFQFFLELIFRFFHFFFMTTAVFVKGFYLIFKMSLSAPVGLFLAGFNWLYGRMEDAYPRVLQKSLKNPGVVLGSVTLLFLFSVFIVGPRLGSELIPEVHQGEFNVEITLPVGTPVEKTDAEIAEIQQYLRRLPGVKRVSSVAGTDKTANANSEEGEHTAKITVTLNRPGDRVPVEEPTSRTATTPANGQFAAVAGDIRANGADADLPKGAAKKPVRYKNAVVVGEEELVETIRDQMQNFPGIRWKISRPVLFSFKTPVEVEIRGYNLQKLQEISTEIEDRMAEIPGITD